MALLLNYKKMPLQAAADERIAQRHCAVAALENQLAEARRAAGTARSSRSLLVNALSAWQQWCETEVKRLYVLDRRCDAAARAVLRDVCALVWLIAHSTESPTWEEQEEGGGGMGYRTTTRSTAAYRIELSEAFRARFPTLFIDEYRSSYWAETSNDGWQFPRVVYVCVGCENDPTFAREHATVHREQRYAAAGRLTLFENEDLVQTYMCLFRDAYEEMERALGCHQFPRSDALCLALRQKHADLADLAAEIGRRRIADTPNHMYPSFVLRR